MKRGFFYYGFLTNLLIGLSETSVGVKWIAFDQIWSITLVTLMCAQLRLMATRSRIKVGSIVRWTEIQTYGNPGVNDNSNFAFSTVQRKTPVALLDIFVLLN